MLSYLDTKYPYNSKNNERCYNNTYPARCFYKEDLYTLKLGVHEDDSIEKHLFGNIDNKGKLAVDKILHPDNEDAFVPPKYYQDLLVYMDAQVVRTPRRLKSFMLHKNFALIQMQKLRQLHLTMWFDGFWEIFNVADGLEFIFSDNPVTFYNRKVFPGSKYGKSSAGPPFSWIGTQTLFPISSNRLLVLTHTQFARNPEYNLCKSRYNPRYYEPTMFNALEVINSRTLSAEDTLKVNFIIKSRADRYIGGSSEELLYPEKFMKHTHWSKISQNEFLLPDPRDVHLTTAVYSQFKNGAVFAQNEYGMDVDDPTSNEIREKESKILTKRQNKLYSMRSK